MNDKIDAALPPSADKIGVVVPASALPIDARREAIEAATATGRTRQVVVQQQLYSGPIPPPEMLSSYEGVLPGAADRILKMSEENGAHVRAMQRRQLNGQIVEVLFGQVAALIIVLCFLGAGAWLMLSGFGGGYLLSISGVTIVAIVGLFIRGRFAKAKRDGKQLTGPPSGAPAKRERPPARPSSKRR